MENDFYIRTRTEKNELKCGNRKILMPTFLADRIHFGHRCTISRSEVGRHTSVYDITLHCINFVEVGQCTSSLEVHCPTFNKIASALCW